MLEEVSPDFFAATMQPSFAAITAPALVVDGALDLLVGPDAAADLFDALGSKDKQLVVLDRSSHALFAEDRFATALSVIDRFLSRLRR